MLLTDPTPEEEAMAEEIATEAMAGLDPLLPAAELEEIREFLVDELLCTEAGRARLRRCLAPRVGTKSDDLARFPDAALHAKDKSGTGS
ncbi:MAG: hypothetical protein U0271_31840 [Polyangiaceae bacterium]